jgi:pyridoxal phosphate-dependent aminotransferase EpsN
MGGDELGLVQEAFATNWIAPLGPHVDAFEREFSTLTGSAHAAALSSGTAALHLAMRWLKLQPGDEVLCSSLTFSATVNPVLYERATPVFVDSDATSWNMDPTLLAEAIADRLKCGRKPKAVILVHLYGQSADLDPIAAICAEHEIPLIEDAAEALGAVYFGKRTAEGGGQASDLGQQTSDVRPQAPDIRGRTADVGHQTSDVSGRSSGIAPGSVGLCGIFSFNGNKIITTSSGGMLVSNDKALVEKARFWATQARDAAPHYEHS